MFILKYTNASCAFSLIKHLAWTVEHASFNIVISVFLLQFFFLQHSDTWLLRFDLWVIRSALLCLQECSWVLQSGLEALLVWIWQSPCGNSWQAWTWPLLTSVRYVCSHAPHLTHGACVCAVCSDDDGEQQYFKCSHFGVYWYILPWQQLGSY